MGRRAQARRMVCETKLWRFGNNKELNRPWGAWCHNNSRSLVGVFRPPPLESHPEWREVGNSHHLLDWVLVPPHRSFAPLDEEDYACKVRYSTGRY